MNPKNKQNIREESRWFVDIFRRAAEQYKMLLRANQFCESTACLICSYLRRRAKERGLRILHFLLSGFEF